MNKIFCLMGPTASGKTDLAIQLVQHFPLEIISVDSAMIYRGMDIGTAKPSAEELALAPHHLINVLNPDQSYCAAAFCQDVLKLSQAIYQRKKYPLLVGGTMMYFHALQQGLSQLPNADEAIRARLQTDLQQNGLSALHARLQDCDPDSASRIHAHDTQRILRALEVYAITGQSLTSLKAQQQPVLEADFHNIALFPEDRAWLHARIAARFETMLAAGLIEEVKTLQALWHIDDSYPAMRTVGYRQVLAYLSGACDYQQLQEQGVAATRQLAKRQITWLRSFTNTWRVDPVIPGYQASVLQWFDKQCSPV